MGFRYNAAKSGGSIVVDSIGGFIRDICQHMLVIYRCRYSPFRVRITEVVASPILRIEGSTWY